MDPNIEKIYSNSERDYKNLEIEFLKNIAKKINELSAEINRLNFITIEYVEQNKEELQKYDNTCLNMEKLREQFIANKQKNTLDIKNYDDMTRKNNAIINDIRMKFSNILNYDNTTSKINLLGKCYIDALSILNYKLEKEYELKKLFEFLNNNGYDLNNVDEIIKTLLEKKLGIS